MQRQFDIISNAIADSRKLQTPLLNLIEEGPFISEGFICYISLKIFKSEGISWLDAKNLGLVDDLVSTYNFEIQLKKKLEELGIKKFRQVPLGNYYPIAKFNDTIAVINIQGTITASISKQIKTVFKDAIENPGVKGIILRIDSPGGDAITSDILATYIKDAKKVNKKPVVASLSNVAASGGYYISCAADKISKMKLF